MPRGFRFSCLKADDVYLKTGEGKPTDIVILYTFLLQMDVGWRDADMGYRVMGPTGVGKSTFINNVLGRSDAPAGGGFQSYTRQVAHYFIDVSNNWKLAEAFEIGGQRIVLVDTPGFDDTEIPDSVLLRRIAVWLALSYNSGMKVGGIIYMYPVYPNRMTRNDRSNIKVFREMCGNHALSKVVLATTRWDICPPEIGGNRQKEVLDTFWSNMRSESTPHTREEATALWNSKESAWDLIKLVLKRRADSHIDGVVLKIQKQLVDKGKKFRETDAAQELRRKVKELIKESGSTSTQARNVKPRALSAEAARLRLPLGARVSRAIGLS
ncbi:hypothetical protein H1R20_g3186, partial [Candolleomyces eurysporus]